MNKLLLLVGAGVGYVLGARAGRERYDQIADQANKLWTDPRVQTKVEEAKAKAPEVAQKVGDQAKAKMDELVAPFGVACFTVAVMMSPTRAYRRREPPRSSQSHGSPSSPRGHFAHG